MINPTVLKKYLAFMILGVGGALAYFIGTLNFGVGYGVGVFVVAFVILCVLANLLLKTPLRDVVEGKGLLAINIDSTGRMTPFILSLDAPFLRGLLYKKKIEDTFDREHTNYLTSPQKGTAEYVKVKNDDGTISEKLVLTLDKSEINNARFAFNQYPTFIFNEMLGSLVTKEFLGGQEKSYFTEHTTLTLLHSIQELVRKTGDYARYVINLESKEQGGLFAGRAWLWIVVILIIGALAVFAGPQIVASLKATFANGAAAVAPLQSGGALVTPRG